MTDPTTSSHWRPIPLDRWDWLAATAIFIGAMVLLLSTMQMGFTRDEGFYFHAGHLYIGWFEDLWANFQAGNLAASFTQASVDQHWGYNREHPVLIKTLFALSHKLFYETLGWTSASTAMRLPAAATAAALLSVVYLFARQLFGRAAGLIAVGALLFQPRFFFHAHLACFDVPIAFFWVAVVYAYWRSYDSRFWALMTGILWGLALSTKLNAFFLPLIMGLHWFLVHWKWFGIHRLDDRIKLRLPPIPWAFVSMAVFGPLLFYALWPRHWFDTFARVKWYMNFHLTHEHYFVDYFGQNLAQPPFPVSFPWLMTLVTVPATILLGFAVGVVVYLHQRKAADTVRTWISSLRQRRWPTHVAPDPRGTGILLAINVVFPLALIAMPDTPIFGGTKHWMPAMPFVAIICAGGVVFTARALHTWLQERRPALASPAIYMALVALLGTSTIGPAVYATYYNHPHGTAYYNELIGSYRGAADRRMMRQFWGYSSRYALPWVNEVAGPNERIWVHNTISYAWSMYATDELRRKDLRSTSMENSNIGLYHQQKAFMFLLIPLWEHYGTYTPSHVVSIDGVPYHSVYVRPDRAEFKHPDAGN